MNLLFKRNDSCSSFSVPEACLFDLDGVLLDTEPLHGQAWSQAAATFGKTLSESQILELRGRRRLECAEKINNWLTTPIGCEKLLSIQQPIARRLLKNANAMPGAENLVKSCTHWNIPMALVSSSSAESIAFKSASHPWLNQIETRVLGDDEGLLLGKPAPDPYILASKKLNLVPKSCWAIEDSFAGTQSALKAGCQVWVLKCEEHKGNDQKQLSDNPNLIKVSHLNIIFQALEQLLKVKSEDQ